MNFNGKKILAKPNGNTYDIIDALINISPQAIEQVQPKIHTLINVTNDAYKDALKVAAYIRKNVKYKADGYENQNIQLPGRVLNDTKQADCKTFSLLFLSMMKAAGHKAGYRFASYRANKIPTHVYNWIIYKNNLLTFDTCVKTLKESPRHTYIKDMDVNYLTGYHEPEYIGRKKGKGKLFKGAKKFALAIPRNAFRTLVSFNARSLATKLNKVVLKDKNKLKNLWEKFGGKFEGKNSLMQSIDKGKNKKPLFGKGKGVSGYYDENFIGEPVTAATIATAITAATPILLVVKKLLTDLKIKGEPGEPDEVLTPDEEGNADASGNKFDDANFVAGDDENKTPGGGLTTGFKISPLIIGSVLGAGVLIYLLTKKKRK